MPLDKFYDKSNWIEENQPQCNDCINNIGDAKCPAFPSGIPDEILFNDFKHNKPYPGQRDITILYYKRK